MRKYEKPSVERINLASSTSIAACWKYLGNSEWSDVFQEGCVHMTSAGAALCIPGYTEGTPAQAAS